MGSNTFNPLQKSIIFTSNNAFSLLRFRLGVMLALKKQGYKVICIAKGDGFRKQIEAQGIEFINVPELIHKINPFYDLIFFFKLTYLIRRFNPDFVFQYSIKPNIYGSFVNSILRIPCISVIAGLGYPFHHKNLLYRIVSFLYKVAIKKNLEVWFLNQHDLDFFENHGLIKSSKARLIPGEGVDIEYYHPCPKASKDYVKFLFTGRILWEKGINEFIEAARIIKLKYPDTQFSLMGFPNEHSERAVSNTKIEDWVNEGIIQYYGPQEDVRPYMCESDCVVLPSYYGEGLSRTILEAGSMQIPVITTKHPGCEEIIEDGITGLLCQPKDINDLARKMEIFLHLKSSERRLMGEFARKRITHNYREEIILEIYAQRLKSFFESLNGKVPPCAISAP